MPFHGVTDGSCLGSGLAPGVRRITVVVICPVVVSSLVDRSGQRPRRVPIHTRPWPYAATGPTAAGPSTVPSLVVELSTVVYTTAQGLPGGPAHWPGPHCSG